MRISNTLWKRLCTPKKKTIDERWVNIISKRPVLFSECPKNLLTDSFIKKVLKKNKNAVYYLDEQYITSSIIDYLIELYPSQKNMYLHLLKSNK